MRTFKHSGDGACKWLLSYDDGFGCCSCMTQIRERGWYTEDRHSLGGKAAPIFIKPLGCRNRGMRLQSPFGETEVGETEVGETEGCRHFE